MCAICKRPINSKSEWTRPMIGFGKWDGKECHIRCLDQWRSARGRIARTRKRQIVV